MAINCKKQTINLFKKNIFEKKTQNKNKENDKNENTSIVHLYKIFN